MAKDPEILAHQEWLGYVQPVGLVVSIPALTQAQAYVNKNIIPDHQRFLACLPDDDQAEPRITDFPAFTRSVLGWEPADLLGTDEGGPVPDSLEVALPEYGETLKPTYAVREFQKGGDGSWLMLIQKLFAGTDFDKVVETDDRRWQASPQAQFERLLRETQVPIGLLTNGTHLRLVYAPRGETSGHATFCVADMASVAGRPIFAALHMLLCADRLFTLSEKERLPAILADSRKYQNLVSTQLAEQVLAALFELLRGFQAADDQAKGELLREALKDDPNQVYHGLLTVLMRLVFVLYAEDRNLLSSDPLYTNYYSVTGLFNRLRADAGRFPDTMDQRYGAWAQLLVLFRIIYDGAKSNGFHIPGRKGYLFDPDRYPFLEGRCGTGVPPVREPGRPLLPNVPRVSDGVVFRVLQNLLILDGERLSYRTLDVEQIGSVYEAIMGFCLEIAGGRSIAVKPVKRHGAPATVNLEELLAVKAADRAKWLRETTDQKFEGKPADGLKAATTIDGLLSALDKKIARHVTPNVVPQGAMVLQPSGERRRSGSHYTPRSLTEPIVRKTLEPILRRLALGVGGLGTEKGTHDERTDSVVSRPAGLASGHGTGGRLLRGDQDVSSRRDVRPDESGSACSSLNSGKHRRGPWSGESQGVSSVSAHGPGESAGIGNAPDAQSASGTFTGTGGDGASNHSRSTRAHDAGTPEVPPNATPTPQLLTPTPAQILDLKICDPAMGSGAFLVETCRQLGDELVKAWHVHNCVPKIPPDEDELLHARRVIAQRCLYGVDKNPMAVDLAKLSLWLATLAKDHPFTFLDHALRAGDSLVGLTRQQIADFHWQRTKEKRLGQEHIEDRIKRATQARKEILDAGDVLPPEQKAQKLAVADEALEAVRFFGDLCIAAFFAGDSDKQRKAKREEYLDRLTIYLQSGDMRQRPTQQVEALHKGEWPLAPFHWEIELPEVFGGNDGGFDAFVGNPPFAGKNTLINGHCEHYLDWLQALHEESHGNADLVAHFFRRAFNLLRPSGCFGLIATKTIGQGDTRTTGLHWICTHGGTIYAARKRIKWPGEAAVTVSLLHVRSGDIPGPYELDRREVPIITAYLFYGGGHNDPETLHANANRSFQGFNVLGVGFTFDDEDASGLASTTAEMRRLLTADARNRECIYPYIGGSELNEEPRQQPSRYVICFGSMAEHEARQWLDLFRIVEERVRPVRMLDKRALRRDTWWLFGERQPDLFHRLTAVDKVIVTSAISTHLTFSFCPATWLFSHNLNVLFVHSLAGFCCLQSRPHEIWVRLTSSTLEDRLGYRPSDSFETFPFPEGFEADPRLEAAGKAYYDFRAALMVKNNEGLTKTYNRFHDPNETSPDIVRLRELHAAMDRAVLDAYGWTDIPTDCEFLLDYEDDEEGDGSSEIGSGESTLPPSPQLPTPLRRSRKKPWRYRWPDDIRDEVLARLLALNAKRAEQERLSGGATEAKRSKGGRGKKRATGRDKDGTPSLYDA